MKRVPAAAPLLPHSRAATQPLDSRDTYRPRAARARRSHGEPWRCALPSRQLHILGIPRISGYRFLISDHSLLLAQRRPRLSLLPLLV